MIFTLSRFSCSVKRAAQRRISPTGLCWMAGEGWKEWKQLSRHLSVVSSWNNIRVEGHGKQKHCSPFFLASFLCLGNKVKCVVRPEGGGEGKKLKCVYLAYLKKKKILPLGFKGNETLSIWNSFRLLKLRNTMLD